MHIMKAHFQLELPFISIKKAVQEGRTPWLRPGYTRRLILSLLIVFKLKMASPLSGDLPWKPWLPPLRSLYQEQVATTWEWFFLLESSTQEQGALFLPTCPFQLASWIYRSGGLPCIPHSPIMVPFYFCRSTCSTSVSCCTEDPNMQVISLLARGWLTGSRSVSVVCRLIACMFGSSVQARNTHAAGTTTEIKRYRNGCIEGWIYGGHYLYVYIYTCFLYSWASPLPKWSPCRYWSPSVQWCLTRRN